MWDPATGKAFKLRAHGVAYALAHGGLAAGVHVLHRPGCEDPGCVNDQHAYAGDATRANAGDRDRPPRRAQLAARRHQAAGQAALPGLGWEASQPGRRARTDAPPAPSGPS